MRIKFSLWILFMITGILACQDKTEKVLIGTWKAQVLENEAMDQILEEQLHFLDTFGRSTTAAQNLEIYGSANVDSIRASLSQTLAEMKAKQEELVRNTWFQFRKDGVALLNFGQQPDSVHWYINEEQQLVLDEMSLKGSGSKIYMNILELNEQELRLEFTENGLTSTVVFLPMEAESDAD